MRASIRQSSDENGIPFQFSEPRLSTLVPIVHRGACEPRQSPWSRMTRHIQTALRKAGTYCFTVAVMPTDSTETFPFLARMCATQMSSIDEPGAYPPLLLNLLISPSVVDERDWSTLHRTVCTALGKAGYSQVPVLVGALSECVVKLGIFRPGIVALSTVSQVLSNVSHVPGDIRDEKSKDAIPCYVERDPLVRPAWLWENC